MGEGFLAMAALFLSFAIVAIVARKIGNGVLAVGISILAGFVVLTLGLAGLMFLHSDELVPRVMFDALEDIPD